MRSLDSMMSIARILISVVVVSSGGAALAGDWQPRSDRKFKLVLPESCSTVTEAQRKWADQLVSRLEKAGGIVKSSEVVPGCPAARLYLNDEPTSDFRIFQQQSTKRYVVVSVPNTHLDSFVVDVNEKHVLEFGGIHTTTAHPHPSGEFAAIVYSHEPVIYGIRVRGLSGNPSFKTGSVRWH